VKGVAQALTELGVRLDGDEWYDGSGLSRDNELDPGTLTDVLRAAASTEHPELRAVLSGLPVAGFTGSLEYRFADVAPLARGHVRAKTGTLRNTAALAGVVTDQDGSSAAFVLMADRVALLKGTAAENALDAAAAALGGCHCSVGGAG
jgi:D-alanyl-D-alanine carboxypeptidase/D-alanyl-D-alanine-endopeptidase (penicillin-binding protein 4)